MLIAREVTQGSANLDVLDLRKQIKRLVAFIKEANGLDV